MPLARPLALHAFGMQSLPWFHTVVDCFTVRMHCMHVDHCMHVTQLPLTLDDVLLS